MNLYDKYVGMNYVPLPFDQMAAAGQMQQKQYDIVRDDMQRQEDALADMKVKPVDVEYKNKMFDEIHKGASEMLSKNKYYSPEMFQDVRSYVRRAARDPRVAMLSASYDNYEKERKLEEQFRVQGKPYFFNHRKNLEIPVYNSDGTMNYDPSQEHLGIEELLDATGAASSLTSRLTPYVSKSKGVAGTIEVKQPDGTIIDVPNIHSAVTSILSSKDPRVINDVKDMVQNFSESPAGRQWLKLNATNPDGSVDKEKALQFMLGTVAEKSSTSYEDNLLQSFAKARSGSGNGRLPIANPSDTYNGLYGINAVPQTQVDLNNKLQVTPETYRNLSKEDKAALYKFARAEYDKVPNSGVIGQPMYASTYEQQTKPSFDKWMETQGSMGAGTKQINPYGSILNKFLEDRNKSNIGKYKADVFNMSNNQATMGFLQNAASGISPDNAILINGDKAGDLFGNHLENVNFQNFEKQPTGEVIKMKDPKNPNLFTYGSVYNVIVDKETAKNAGINVDDNQNRNSKYKVTNAEGKEEAGYIVPTLVQHDSFVTPESLAQYDKSKDANWDEKYNTAGSYKQNYDMWRANTTVQQNFDYIKKLVNESGADIIIDASGQLIMSDPKNGQYAVDPINLLQSIQQ